MHTGSTFEGILRFSVALGDQTRLRILGLLFEREQSVDELANRLCLKAPTVSHHLAKLKSAGLVTVKKNAKMHLYSFDIYAMNRFLRRLLAAETMQLFAKEVAYQVFVDTTIREFVVDGRLLAIPERAHQRRVVFDWIVQSFPFDRRYGESDVDKILSQRFDNVVHLKEELLHAEYLSKDSSNRFWRVNSLGRTTC